MRLFATLVAVLAVGGQAQAQNKAPDGLAMRTTPAASDVLLCQPAGMSVEGCTVSGLQAWLARHWTSPVYPVQMRAPDGSFLYMTQGFPSGTGTVPTRNIIALGWGVIDAASHNDPTDCYDMGAHFCGDEVALGTNNLRYDLTGHDNTAIGDDALPNLISGNNNTAVGSSALAIVGNSRTANTSFISGFGVSACQNVSTTSGPLTCIGPSSLQNAGPSSQYSTALGFQAALNTRDVEFSVAIGDAAVRNTTSMIHSIALGWAACGQVTTMSHSICIGPGTGPVGAMTDTLYIGGDTNAQPILYGNLSTNQIGVGTTKLPAGVGLNTPLGFAGAFVRTTASTVAGLASADPAPATGDRAFVTDATACTFNSRIRGGGSTACPVVYSGGGWVAG